MNISHNNSKLNNFSRKDVYNKDIYMKEYIFHEKWIIKN